MAIKAAVVTGATSGIGLAITKLLCDSMMVVGIGRDPTRLQQLSHYSSQILPYQEDLLEISAPNYKLDKFKQFLNYNKLEVDTFVHSAGIGLSQSFTALNKEDLDKIFKVNVSSAFVYIDTLLPNMLSRQNGNICLISSMAGLYGYKYNGAYAATKHALVGIAKSLAKEHGKRGIISTAVCPGMTDTPMTQKMIASLMRHQQLTKEEAVAKIAATNPQNRIIAPEEVAATVQFLCSGKVPALNGSVITLGGGE